MHQYLTRPISTNADFENDYRYMVKALLNQSPTPRGSAHASQDATTAETYELMHVSERFQVDAHQSAWAEVIKPNLPWAEDHFQERIGGQPLNPSPAEAWWPYARKGNAEHKKDEKFSHTYPERFWPKFAGLHQPVRIAGGGNWGVRFPLGDLNDLLEVLQNNRATRQAYLPIWFPEDIAAARSGERVPCSLGYHFIWNPSSGHLDCVYSLRSCDIVRFYRDDMYMAGRLLQHVATEVGMTPGLLVTHIDNLHCFPGDRPFLEQITAAPKPRSRRDSYNFDALM